MSKCCKECANHTPGCHDGCIKYLAESLADREVKNEIYKERRKEKNAIGREIDTVRRMKRSK